jgi:HEAT repeat protein
MGSYLPLTSFLRIHYLHALETLGPDARDPVREAYKESKGKVREWYGLALGATFAPEAALELRGLLARSSDLAVRMTAARYLGWLKDRNAIPVLTAALKDTATATPVTDVIGSGSRRFHPVREQAARALRELGLRTEWRGDSIIAY